MSPADLQRLYPFEYFPQKDLADLAASFQRRQYPAGAAVFRQGDSPKSMYWIEIGAVKLSRKGRFQEETGLLAPGAFFGELGFLDSATRGVSATAADAVTLHELSYDGLRSFLKERPISSECFYRGVAENLLSRLRRMSDDADEAERGGVRLQ